MSVVQWQWVFDEQRQCLQLEMDGLLLDLSFQRRVLQQNIPALASFDTDDATHYNRVKDYLEDRSTLSVSQQLQATLHATAALRFLKPSLPQSWHFRFSEVIEQWPDTHLLCCLDSGIECADFLILAQDERTSLCMLLGQDMRLAPTKSIQQFDCIRVLNDRLHEHPEHPIAQQWSSDWRSGIA